MTADQNSFAAAAASVQDPLSILLAELSWARPLTTPPGFAGALTDAIYDSAERPVKEVAIVGALGLLAGICGKAYCISNDSGLNLYMILVARSAIGKETMHSGISMLLREAATRVPSIFNFVDFGDFASGPALVKACAANTCFLNVCGEWGRKLLRMANDKRGQDIAMASLRTVMTNLYHKSGPQAIVGGITYSNRDSNIQAVSGVAYSMIGETTPTTFYQALTETMMADGFMSRLTIIEYTGERPDKNANRIFKPLPAVTEYLAQLAQYAGTQMLKGSAVNIDLHADAAWLFELFSKYCDKKIQQAADNESSRQMWNRAELKALRIAGLLAASDNFSYPAVTIAHAKWAIDLTLRDISAFERRLATGDVGDDDHARERKIVAVLRDYILNGASQGYKVSKAMTDNHIVPYSYLRRRVNGLTQFKTSQELDITIGSLQKSGYLFEVQKDKLSEHYNYFGKAYRVLSLPDASQ